LLEAYDKAHKGPPGGARKLIEEAPEAVIRCKDCKHGAPTIINGAWLSVTCGDVDHRPDWFCADGERRDDDA
jgi:hypothetical protein